MLGKTGDRSLLKGLYVLGAANVVAIGGLALAVFAEAPAFASVNADDFTAAFAPVEVQSKETAAPKPSEILATEQHIAAAPIEDEIEPAQAEPFASGGASYYGNGFAGRRTASGERFDPTELTAAHRTLPFGTRIKVTNQANGDSVIVRINDRGPFHGNRIIDLSREAARQIGLLRSGHGRVHLARLTDTGETARNRAL